MSPTVEQMTDQQFEAHAMDVLGRELGVDGLARFLRLYRSGKGDYTQDRDKWLHGTTIKEIAERSKQQAA